MTDEATPKIQVVWSRKLINGAFSAGPAEGEPSSTIPPALKIKGSFLVRAESSLAYEPVITWAASAKATLGLAAAFDGISMAETYYLRPRRSTTIPCRTATERSDRAPIEAVPDRAIRLPAAPPPASSPWRALPHSLPAMRR